MSKSEDDIEMKMIGENEDDEEDDDNMMIEDDDNEDYDDRKNEDYDDRSRTSMWGFLRILAESDYRSSWIWCCF